MRAEVYLNVEEKGEIFICARIQMPVVLPIVSHLLIKLSWLIHWLILSGNIKCFDHHWVLSEGALYVCVAIYIQGK